MRRILIALAVTGLAAAIAEGQERRAAVVNTAAARAAADADARRDAGGVQAFKAGAPGYEKATLPVLALGTEGPSKGAPVFAALPKAHTVFYRLDGAELSIMAQGTEIVEGEASSEPAPDSDPVFEVLRDDEEGYLDGAELNFVRFGIGYTLRLKCDQAEDKRCLEPAFLRAAYSSLVVVEDGT
jgi:hypothetical protein